MSKKRKASGVEHAENLSVDPIAARLAALGEAFMSSFDDCDKQQHQQQPPPPQQQQHLAQQQHARKRSKHARAGADQHHSQNDHAPIPAHAHPSPDASSEQRRGSGAPARPSKVERFLYGRGAGAGTGRLQATADRRNPGGAATQQPAAAAAAAAAQAQLLEKRMRKRFMSHKAADIFADVPPQPPPPAAAAAEDLELRGVTPAEFRDMQQEVERLGASALDKKERRKWKAAMLARIGARPEKAARTPASLGVGMAKRAAERAARQLEEAMAAGMVKRKGHGKKARAESSKHRDRGLMEAGGAFKNGVLRIDKLGGGRGGGGGKKGRR